MLEAEPKNFHSWDYAIRQGDGKVADLDLALFREKAGFELGQARYEIRRDSVLGGTFSLRCGEKTIAAAKKESVFTRSFAVSFEGRELRLAAPSLFFRKMGLFEHGAPMGSISPKRWFSNAAVIDLGNELPLPVQLFLFCLVVFLWRRAASESSSS